MTSVLFQRDLVVTLKKETLLNVGILGKIHPMSSELSRLLKENKLEKPTQNLFNHLAHFLVSIIDPHLNLPWPLYDSKNERVYRNEVSLFISDYSSKGLLAPVVSSYLVNPGCYKVIFLMFQMSQLAVQRMLLMKMKKDSQKELYNDMTEKFKTQKDEGFIECIDKETDVMLSKFSNYLCKRETLEKTAKQLRDQITKMEDKLKSLKAQEYIDHLVDGYIKTHTLDEEAKKEILEIKNVRKPAKFFEKWLVELDKEVTQMESRWESKTAPFLEICQTTVQNTETLIARQTGEADKRTFMIEYNPKTDNLFTEELEKQVNTQQKYILKNITKEEKLYFPNLIRGFLISICFILKNAEIGDEIYIFNEYLEGGRRNYSEVVNDMKFLMERVMKAEAKFQPPQITVSSTVSTRDTFEIPPLPDLSDLKINRNFHPQIICNTFTPLNITKHQFNLRKQRTGFTRPQSKVFATPFHNVHKEDFFKSPTSFRVNAYDKMDTTHNTNLNVSVISQVKGNETIAECTSGFTKQQIRRLLSTKKSSSSKKFKRKTERPDIKVVKGGLFNESMISNESICLFRSHSSPNLNENRDSRARHNIRSRKLSIMKEDSPTLLEVSGIAALDRDSNHSTPQGLMSLEISRKLMDTTSLPSLSTNVTLRSDVSDITEVDLNKEIEFKAPQLVLPQRKSKESVNRHLLIPLRKSKLPQPKSKSTIGNQPVVSSQRTSLEMFEEPTMLPKRKSNEKTDDKIVLPLRKSSEIFEEQVLPQRRSLEFTKSETPKTNPIVIKKTSSLEKIINRFKKVRASVLPSELIEEDNASQSIFDEKENCNSVNVDVVTANRNLLPDLLSPSCSIVAPKQQNDVLDEFYIECSEEEKYFKPRLSLGAALGVDHTFLDQFDLSD